MGNGMSTTGLWPVLLAVIAGVSTQSQACSILNNSTINAPSYKTLNHTSEIDQCCAACKSDHTRCLAFVLDQGPARSWNAQTTHATTGKQTKSSSVAGARDGWCGADTNFQMPCYHFPCCEQAAFPGHTCCEIPRNGSACGKD